MSKEPKSLDFETRYEEAKLLPHYVWKANADVRKKYSLSNRPSGAIYDTSAVVWLRTKGIGIPEPRSLFREEWLYNTQFLNYWKKDDAKWDSGAFAIALRKVRSSYSHLHDLKMAHYDDVQYDIVNDPEKAKASSGLPHLMRKRDAMAMDLGHAQAIATGRVAPPPAVGYHRSQEGKVRLVWGYPLSVLLVEGRFMLPIERALRTSRVPYVAGLTSCGISGRLAKLSYTNVQYCLDWSKFDSLMPRCVIGAMFSVVQSWFADVDQKSWDLVARYFATCPVLMPKGEIFVKRTRGIPSGSWFTQLIGSMCNQFLVEYLSVLSGDGIVDGVYLGDDSVIGMSRMPDVEKWAALALEVGMVIHPDKQIVTHGRPHFLAHEWGGLFPIREMEKTLSRLATSERSRKFKSKEEYFDWTIDKARALLVDNPSAFNLLADYIAWRLRIPLHSAMMNMSCGAMVVGTTMRDRKSVV